MKVLILGYSDFAKRRIIPILINQFSNIKLAIASKSRKRDFLNNDIKWFNNYDLAIQNYKPDIIYISLPNSLHFKWAKKSLLKRINVIVDKPISLYFKQAKELVDISNKKKTIIAEATIFFFHSQITKSIKLVGGIDKIKQINCNFSIPMPDKNNIKLSKKFGGGVNNDMGPYAAASFREFYRKFPKKIFKIQNKVKNITTQLNVIAKFQNKQFNGHFSFGTEYKNEMTIFSDKELININSVFSPNPNLDTKLIYKKRNKIKKIFIKKQSTFKKFFSLYINKIKNKEYDYFHKNIIYDAKFRQILNDK